MTGTLEGRSAIVTGAGRGIGRSIALRLAEEGARVIVNDIERTFAESVAEKVRAGGGAAMAAAADVTNGAEIESLFADVARQFGEIHIIAVR